MASERMTDGQISGLVKRANTLHMADKPSEDWMGSDDEREYHGQVADAITQLRERAENAEAALACHKACLDEAHEFLDDAKKRITLAEQQRDAAIEALEFYSLPHIYKFNPEKQMRDDRGDLYYKARDTLARIRELGESSVTVHRPKSPRISIDKIEASITDKVSGDGVDLSVSIAGTDAHRLVPVSSGGSKDFVRFDYAMPRELGEGEGGRVQYCCIHCKRTTMPEPGKLCELCKGKHPVDWRNS